MHSPWLSTTEKESVYPSSYIIALSLGVLSQLQVKFHKQLHACMCKLLPAFKSLPSFQWPACSVHVFYQLPLLLVLYKPICSDFLLLFILQRQLQHTIITTSRQSARRTDPPTAGTTMMMNSNASDLAGSLRSVLGDLLVVVDVCVTVVVLDSSVASVVDDAPGPSHSLSLWSDCTMS